LVHIREIRASRSRRSATFARMEGQIAIGAILQRFPSLHLDADPGSLLWRRGIFLRGLQRLLLVVE
jgi:cytochrome P450